SDDQKKWMTQTKKVSFSADVKPEDLKLWDVSNPDNPILKLTLAGSTHAFINGHFYCAVGDNRPINNTVIHAETGKTSKIIPKNMWVKGVLPDSRFFIWDYANAELPYQISKPYDDSCIK